MYHAPAARCAALRPWRRYVFDSAEEAAAASSSPRYEVAKSEAEALAQAQAK